MEMGKKDSLVLILWCSAMVSRGVMFVLNIPTSRSFVNVRFVSEQKKHGTNHPYLGSSGGGYLKVPKKKENPSLASILELILKLIALSRVKCLERLTHHQLILLSSIFSFQGLPLHLLTHNGGGKRVPTYACTHTFVFV